MTDKEIIVSFVTQNDPLSALIRHVSRGPVSHAEFITPDGYRLGSRFKGGIQKRAMDYEPFTYEARITIPCAIANSVYALADSYIGSKYDWPGLLNFVLPGHDIQAAGQDYCSEFVDRVLRSLSVTRPAIFPPESTSPVDLLRMLEQLGTLEIVTG